jgi:hypothetical protein
MEGTLQVVISNQDPAVGTLEVILSGQNPVIVIQDPAPFKESKVKLYIGNNLVDG